jgi:hypothetical protein
MDSANQNWDCCWTPLGEKVQAYTSTTSLMHLVNGNARNLNAETLPIAVAPSADLLGKIVWLGGSGYPPSLALIGEVGRAFGEGSIALHQLLRYGAVAEQKRGPIAVRDRCHDAEVLLKLPSYPGQTARTTATLAYTHFCQRYPRLWRN